MLVQALMNNQFLRELFLLQFRGQSPKRCCRCESSIPFVSTVYRSPLICIVYEPISCEWVTVRAQNKSSCPNNKFDTQYPVHTMKEDLKKGGFTDLKTHQMFCLHYAARSIVNSNYGWRNLKAQQSSVISSLDLCLRNTWSGKSSDYLNQKAPFPNCYLST